MPLLLLLLLAKPQLVRLHVATALVTLHQCRVIQIATHVLATTRTQHTQRVHVRRHTSLRFTTQALRTHTTTDITTPIIIITAIRTPTTVTTATIAITPTIRTMDTEITIITRQTMGTATTTRTTRTMDMVKTMAIAKITPITQAIHTTYTVTKIS